MLALCIQIARKLRHDYSPTYHFGTFGRQIKIPTFTHTGQFISVPLCFGQSELASICLFVQLIINLMYNVKKLYFNDQHKFRV